MIVNYGKCCAILLIILAVESIGPSPVEAAPLQNQAPSSSTRIGHQPIEGGGLLRVGQPSSTKAHGTALLRGLNKITAQVSILRARRDNPIRFGTMEITVLACYRKPPEEIPESAVRLLIRESRDGEGEVVIFSGWMFAHSPAVSTLEHPVYDIRLLDCDDSSVH